MVLEHLFKHGIGRGFCVIQQCHSTFLGACRATRCSVRRVGTHASLASRVQAGALSPWAETTMGRPRTCTADGRVRNKRCHLEVGAPAQPDNDTAVMRTM